VDGFLGALSPVNARKVRASLGANLTVIYSNESVASQTTRPTAILPLLVILFIVSYGILTMLVFEQGQTIESQRGLIHEMLRDSSQLAALKGKLARDDGKQSQDQAAVPTDSKAPQAGNAGGAKGSEAKALDKETKRPSKSARAMKEVPGRPAADLEDVRRSTRVI
jgi:hypothetical protein